MIGELFLTAALLALVAMVVAGSSRTPDSPDTPPDAWTAADQTATRAASTNSPELLWPAAPETFADGAGI
jgi:hypothetical protein